MNFRALRVTVSLRNLFLFGVFLLIAINAFQLVQDLIATHRLRRIAPYPYQGYKFSGLKKFLKNVQFVGYCTDKNLDVTKHAQLFSHAQYELAPIILDLNDAQHEFLLLDYINQNLAKKKIEELKLIPLKQSSDGIILARRLPPGSAELLPSPSQNGDQ